MLLNNKCSYVLFMVRPLEIATVHGIGIPVDLESLEDTEHFILQDSFDPGVRRK